MENNLDNQLLFKKFPINTNKQATDELKEDCDGIKKKLNKYDFGFYDVKALLNKVIGQNKTSSPDNMVSTKSQLPTAAAPDNKKATPSEGGNSKKLVACGISNMR